MQVQDVAGQDQPPPAPHASGPTLPGPPPGRSVLERTAIGMGWIVGWRVATRALGLLNTFVLIRLLAPEDFGLVALATVFIGALDTLSALGVEDSLVREPHPTPALYDTAFTLNLLRGALTAGLVAAAALPAAGFFNEPRLAPVLWALAAGTLVSGAHSIGTVDFRREINFRKEFVLQILPRVLSILVAIGTAAVWQTYWALVAGILVGGLARSGFSYRMHPWRPRLGLHAWRYLIGFSGWSWGIGLAELVRDRMNAFVLGRALDAAAVGLYAAGEDVSNLPTTELVLPLCRSCFSGFSAARAAGHDMAETFLRPVALAFLVTAPMGLGLSLVADPVVRLVIGERWVDAIPVIQVLAALGGAAVFGAVASVLLSAHAMLARQLGIVLAGILLRAALVLPLVAAHGVLGAALAALAGTALEHGLFLAAAARRFGIPPAGLLRRCWRPAAAAAAMAAALAGAGLGWTAAADGATAQVRMLAAGVGLGAATYGTVLAGLWWVCGRPGGAEADALAVARRVVGTMWRWVG